MKFTGAVASMWQNSVDKMFTDDLARMLLFSQQQLGPLHYTTSPVSYHELARKHIVDTFLGDWVLMLDTDHSFSPDLLIRMLALKEKYNCRVLSAIYQYKHPPHSPVAGFWREDGKPTPLIDWDRRGDIVDVGTVGAGCLLVDRSVFNEIKNKLHEDPFTIRLGLSEDYSFCERCKELDIPVSLALQIECHHVVRSVLSVKDYAAPPSDKKLTQVYEGKVVSC